MVLFTCVGAHSQKFPDKMGKRPEAVLLHLWGWQDFHSAQSTGHWDGAPAISWAAKVPKTQVESGKGRGDIVAAKLVKVRSETGRGSSGREGEFLCINGSLEELLVFLQEQPGLDHCGFPTPIPFCPKPLVSKTGPVD